MPAACGTAPTLEIHQYERVEPGSSPFVNRRGYGHLAFRVDDVADVRARILDAGGSDVGRISETDVPGVGHLTFIYMADPEGNILELQNSS